MPFGVGDFVWAKMRSYRAWPARRTGSRFGEHGAGSRITTICTNFAAQLMNREQNLRWFFSEYLKTCVKKGSVQVVKRGTKALKTAKRNMYYVYFFGEENYAWIDEDNVFPYEKMKEKFIKDPQKTYEMKRKSSFWCAVEAIESEIRGKLLSFKKVKQSLKDEQRHLRRSSTPKLGFLGSGFMCKGLIKNLIVSDHEVVVWQKTMDECEDFDLEYVKEADTPAKLVGSSDVIFSCMSDENSLREVMFGKDGALKEMNSAKVYVEMTPLGADFSKSISEAVTESQGAYLEAQILGSKQLAEAGNLILLVAGEHSVFEDCIKFFSVIAEKAFFIGERIGDAVKISTAYSMIMGTTVAAIAEAFVFAEKLGFSHSVLMEIIKNTGFDCPFFREKGCAMTSQSFRDGLPLKHLQKSLEQAICMSNRGNFSLPITSVVHEVCKHVVNMGCGNNDISAVYWRGVLQRPQSVPLETWEPSDTDSE